MIKKLYKVTCRGMQTSFGIMHGINYVVASDLTAAYAVVRKNLDEKDIGFEKDRELETIELLAEETDYPNCNVHLYME